MAAEIEVGETKISVPDCEKEGDHLVVMRQLAEQLLRDDRVIFVQSTCVCGLILLLQRHPNSGEITGSVENKPQGDWLGM